MTPFCGDSPEGEPCWWQGLGIKLLDGYTGGNLIQKPYNEWTRKELVAVATQFPCCQERVFFFLLHLAGARLPSTLLEKEGQSSAFFY